MTVPGLGQTRGDEPVVGDHEQRWIPPEVIGRGPGEVPQEPTLDGDGKGRKGVYDALACPCQDREAQRAAPGVLVEPVETRDPEVLHVVGDAQIEASRVVALDGLQHGVRSRHVPASGGDGGEEDRRPLLPRAHRASILSHPACPYHRAVIRSPSESETRARHPSARSVAEVSQVQVREARSLPLRSSNTGTPEKGLAASSAARPASVKAGAGRRTVLTLRPRAFSSPATTSSQV